MSDQLTIREVKDLMRPQLDKGCTCLACGQRVQMYHRALTSSMAYALILIYVFSRNNTRWIHLENFLKQTDVPAAIRGDAPKLRFWGFIIAKEGNKEDGNPNQGFYSMTKKGMDFVEAKILVQKKVKIYNNTFYGFEGGEIDIHAALKGKFNYSQLLNGGG